MARPHSEQISKEDTPYLPKFSLWRCRRARRYIGNYWTIENSQHWVLDVTFREDESPIYAEDGAKTWRYSGGP